MTPEEQNPTPEDMRKAMRMMRVRMRNCALHHLDRVGPRTLRMLQNLDLFDDDAPPIGEEVDPSVLRDPQHPKRVPLPEGPLVLYVTEDETPKRMVVELPVLLFSENGYVRTAAFECIEKSLQMDAQGLTPKTAKIMQELREPIRSDAPETWRPAAVAVSDALYDDVLVALGGTQQSLQCEPAIQNSLNFYTPRIMHPSVSSLDSIEIPAGHPEKEHAKLASILAEIVSHAASVAELCNGYLDRLGFLPLAPAYSLGRAVSEWHASHADVDVWQEVWNWAHAQPTPLSRYHACAVFVRHPELVPEGQLPTLWEEVLEVVCDAGKKGADRPQHAPWALRRELAKHYTYHLEAQLPDNDGASIACFAWWFAEKVAGLFPYDPGSAAFYLENWVKAASDMSSHVWLAASSPIQRSFLRYVTFTVPSPWAVSLLALMGDFLEKLAPDEQTEEVRARFHEAVIGNAICSLPFPIDNPEDPTFAMECSVAETVLKWAERQTEEHKNALHQLVATSKTLGNNEGVCEGLHKLKGSPLADQVAVCLALKAKAYTAPEIAEGVWEVVSDQSWREEVLATAETRVQGLLIECLSVLLVDNREKWYSFLPHYIADLCEKAQDEEQRRILFLYVIHTSLASDTASAVRRLVRGDHKAKFVEFAKEYRDRVEAMRENYPPWVAGKLRGLMASLHVV